MRRLLTTALALAAWLAVAPVASAGTGETTRAKTQAKLSYSSSGESDSGESFVLRGKVKSRGGDTQARRLCRKGRKVSVPGAGRARTSRKGKFAIRLPDLSPAGTYRAKLKRKIVRIRGERIVCGKAKSKKLRVSELARSAEPVVLTGERLLPFSGVAPNELVAFSYRRNAGWTQVPVQVDERHVVDLDAIHNDFRPPAYSILSLEYADPGTLSGPDADPAMDSDDEVVFMARDLRGRAPAGVPDPAGVRAGSGQEVRISDPLDPEAAAWVYLFRHDGSLDPAAGRDYVDYDFELLPAGKTYPDDYLFGGGPGDPVGNPPQDPAPPANPENSRVTTSFYSERFADRWITDELRITAGAASGVDILDRNRLGVPFVSDQTTVVCPRSENTFAAGHGAFVANIDGPVRAIRDYLGANSGLYTQRRQVFYERREDLTTFLRLHPVDNNLVDLLDYDAAAIGMSYRNDLMGASPAVTIDGNPDSVPTGVLSWELVEGPQGSLVSAHRVDTDIPGYAGTSIYLDDSAPDQLPCTGDSQALGTSGPSTPLTGTPRTDPTPRGDLGNAGLPGYRLTSTRTHFYEPPGVSADAAERRSDEARTPLVTAVAPRG